MPSSSDPLGLAQKLRAEADAMLDRVEHAVKNPSTYDLADNQKDVELFARFWAVWEERLSHREIAQYQQRVESLRTWNTKGTIIA